MFEGGYSIAVFGINANKSLYNYELKDHDGNSLKVLGFGNDFTTGRPYVSGNIISKNRGNAFSTGKQIAKGTYSGVFTINFTGHTKADVKEMFSYWSDGSQAPAISKNGKYEGADVYSKFARSIRDYQGNTYFVGSAFVKKIKWGVIGSSVVLSPLLVVSPMLLGIAGTQKCKITDAMILKQNSKGALSFESTIDCNSSHFVPARVALVEYDAKRFYQVSNSNTKSNYVIVDDLKDIVIYNINQKKIARTVPHKDGQVRTNIYPAKEGYVMVSEYNRKEKYTRLSIEAL